MTQQEALTILKLGHNVFLTGAAGSGKTYVLNQFIEHLNKHKIGVGVTASTGIAATHMNGMTIHSWAGIGIREDIDKLGLEKLLAKSQLIKRFEKTKVLIIDEVSMLHGKRLDLVDKVCRAFKDKEKPFGGLQVVLSGDLFQLPPVTRGGSPDFVFESEAWKSMNIKVCYLHEQHRQEDEKLLDILNSMRNDAIEDFHYETLKSRFDTLPRTTITRLYTHNADVDRINQEALENVNGEERSYLMEASGTKKLQESLMASCLAPQELVLKVGAEVMFVANSPAEGFFNGTRGKVIAFTDDDLPIVRTHEGRTIVPGLFTWKVVDGDKTRAEISQLPLRLGWAITIHKSQGMSLDSAEIDLSKSFEPGMGYVALSRVRTLSGLHLKGMNDMALQMNMVVRALDGDLRRQSAGAVAGLKQLGDDAIEQHHKRVRTALAPIIVEEEYDEALFESLRAWRRGHAEGQSMPPYVILPDKTLKGIATILPADEHALAKINGIGPQKLERYGKELLVMVEAHVTKD